MRFYQVYSVVKPTGLFNRFERDRSIKALAEGDNRCGGLITDVYSAGQAAAQRIARKRWGRTAEAIVRHDGCTSDGAVIFYAEIWTRSRTRFADELRFAVRTIED